MSTPSAPNETTAVCVVLPGGATPVTRAAMQAAAQALVEIARKHDDRTALVICLR